jgi:3-hydroxyacyl-CoA dehydrogenase/enoyl-CoA hydratase/3-hydroxybutyryl-CoA epimerase
MRCWRPTHPACKIEDLRGCWPGPARLIGIHFFNPVAKMPLVEVVAATGADPEMLQRGNAFVRQIDRLPLPVRSAPGFLVNAVLGPYMLEAMRAVDEGLHRRPSTRRCSPSACRWGRSNSSTWSDSTSPWPPAAASPAPAPTPPACLLANVFNAGHLGKKAGRGFYDYPNGRPAKGAAGAVPAGLAARLVKPLLERTQQLVSDGIVADADLADAGVIFGTGFAPFTGGPLNYLRSQHA